MTGTNRIGIPSGDKSSGGTAQLGDQAAAVGPDIIKCAVLPSVDIHGQKR